VKFICSFIMVTIVFSSVAISQDTLWTKTYGHAGSSDLGLCGDITSDGGFLISGVSVEFTGGDVWVVRCDSNGDTLWTANYGGARWQQANQIIETADSGAVVVGDYSVASGDDDLYIIRLDPNGDSLWTRRFGQIGENDGGQSIIELSDNGFLAVGSGRNAGNTDLYMVKVNSDGDEQWTKHYGGSNAETGYGVVELSDGGFIITGSTSSGSIGNSDLWLLRTDSDGDTLWTRKYDFHGGMDRGDAIVSATDGDFVIGGRTWNGTYANLLGLRVDSLGNQIWASEFGTPSLSEFAESIAMTDDNGFVIGGGSGTSSFDFYVVRLNSAGDSLWAALYDGPAGDSDDCYEIKVDGVMIYAFGYSDIANPGYDPEYWVVNIIDQTPGNGCQYIVGDINDSGFFNGLDITYGVSYFKGGPVPPYTCECTPGNTWYVGGDVNASCSYNGLDITYGVAYFKGGSDPMPCPDCPPRG
jgi:hypothetical protein